VLGRDVMSHPFQGNGEVTCPAKDDNVNRQSMPVKASFFGVSSKPNHAAVATLIEAARLSVRDKMFGRKAL